MMLAVYHLKPWELARFTQGELTELINQLPEVRASLSQVRVV